MFHRKQEGISNRMGSAVSVRRNSQNNRTITIQLLISLVLAWQSWLPASAQDFYGSLVGRVSPSTGAVVRGASVTLTSLATTETREATTDDTGSYRFVNLVPGFYRVEIESAGLKHLTQDRVDVRVDTVAV